MSFTPVPNPALFPELTTDEYDLCEGVKLRPDIMCQSMLPVLAQWSKLEPGCKLEDIQNKLIINPETNFIFETLIDLGRFFPVVKKIPSRVSLGTLWDDMQRVHSSTPFCASEELAQLLYAIVSKVSSAEQLLLAINKFYYTQLPRNMVPDLNPAMITDDLRLLHQGWNDEFCGDSLKALKQMLSDYEEQMIRDDNAFYSRCINIIQSSGTGKSRLMAQLASEEISVSFTFRFNGESGYPPGDPEIRRFLLEPKSKPKELYIRSLALLLAVFAELDKWLEESTTPHTDVAKELARLMAPAAIDKPPPQAPTISDMMATTRSSFRKEFCKRVRERALVEVGRLRVDRGWDNIFEEDVLRYDHLHNLPGMPNLRQAAEGLCEKCRERTKGANRLVALVFDEALPLVQPKASCDVYTALRFILSKLKHLPIWAFFLSTNASVSTSVLPRHQDRSLCIVRGNLHRVSSYYALPMDMGIIQQFRDNPEAVRHMPLAQVGTPEHMTLYGRPLWRIHETRSLSTLRKFAACKLFCDPEGKYDPTMNDHVFAALAARVSLDPCSAPGASSVAAVDNRAEIVEKAVDMHLRLIEYMDETARLVVTKTPSEPVVSDAVSYKFARNPIRLWFHSIECLARRLLPRGIVDKGTKGELYARVLFIMAIDILRCENKLAQDEDVPFQPISLLKFLKSLVAPQAYDALVMLAQQGMRHSARQVQKTMMTEQEEVEHADGDTNMVDLDLVEEAELANIDLDSKAERTEMGAQTVGQAFEGAFVHFTRFVDTDVVIKPKDMIDLLHMLFLEQAALQCAWMQPVYDLLIPVYLGDPKETFNRDNLTALIVQVKNRTKMGGPEKVMLTRNNLTEEFGNELKRPVLFLVLELGTKEHLKRRKVLEPINSFALNIFQCRLLGASGDTYAPLLKDDDLKSVCDALLSQTTQRAAMAETIAHNNHVFRRHSLEDRFTSTSANT